VKRIYLLAIATAALLLVGGGSNAFASSSTTCSNGALAGGTYGSVTVTGTCSVAYLANITINGNLTVSNGAVFAGIIPSSVHVTGNVNVGKGALLGLGYATTTDLVDGNVTANQPLSLYLGSVTIHGSVVSIGGGTAARFYNFPIKDNTIDGNLIIQGWTGGWWGAIANTVGGSVVVANNTSAVHATDDAGCTASGTFPAGCPATVGPDTDAGEVQSRATPTPVVRQQIISGNLICLGNSPAAQIDPGDGGGPNVVSGQAIGECAGLVAGKPGPLSCSGGTAAVPQDIVAGTYGRVTVSGVCRFNGDVTINGGLVVAAGGVLNDHASGVPFMTAHVVINGDVQVQNGAVLGLGNYGPPGIKTNTVVNGNIVADRPLDLYLSGITVHGSVVSNGGGPGTSQFLNFPTKDDTIDGNLIMNGWQGGWIGAIRDTVGGSVIVSNNASVVHETPVGCDDMDPNPANHCTGFAPGPDTDSTEVVTNTITGNLICVGNTPAAQFGDSGGLPNTVSGNKIGECARL
jgi:hypothetical protein